MQTETQHGAFAPSATALPAPTVFLSPQDLMRRWGCCDQTLRNRRKRNQSPRAIRIGGKIRYRLADIEAFEKEAEEG